MLEVLSLHNKPIPRKVNSELQQLKKSNVKVHDIVNAYVLINERQLSAMFTSQYLQNIVSKALEIDSNSLSDESSAENVEQWDSIGHISILGLLEEENPGILDKYPDLAIAVSVRELIQVLNTTKNS